MINMKLILIYDWKVIKLLIYMKLKLKAVNFNTLRRRQKNKVIK